MKKRLNKKAQEGADISASQLVALIFVCLAAIILLYVGGQIYTSLFYPEYSLEALTYDRLIKDIDFANTNQVEVTDVFFDIYDSGIKIFIIGKDGQYDGHSNCILMTSDGKVIKKRDIDFPLELDEKFYELEHLREGYYALVFQPQEDKMKIIYSYVGEK